MKEKKECGRCEKEIKEKEDYDNRKYCSECYVKLKNRIYE